jgi:hypothetical protein
MPFTVQGLEKIQAARMQLIYAMQPNGALGKAVLLGTTQMFRGVQTRIHRDTGTYAAAQIPKVNGLKGMVYTGAYKNPKSGQAASVYGPFEEARGGGHAAYANTFKGDAPGVMHDAIKIVIAAAAMSVQSRKVVREEVGQVLAMRLTTAQQVYTDQPTDFQGQSPVVVVTSDGSERDGGPVQRTFGGPVAPKFYLDIYVFVATLEKNAGGEDVTNADADNQLDTLEAGVAEFVAAYPSAQTWTAIGYSGRTDTTFVTVLDGSEYKRERIPLVITGK